MSAVICIIHETNCISNLINFPFDEQECLLVLIAQNAESGQVKLNPTTADNASNHAQWDIVGISAISTEVGAGPNYNLSLATAIVAIQLARLPTFYVLNIILPIFFLGLIGLGSFMIPLKSGERASVCISVVLGITIFQVVLSDVLPRTSRPDQMPILYSYGSKSFFFLVSLTMASFFNIWLCSLSGNLRWKFVRILFFKVLAVAVLLGQEGRRNIRKYSGKT